MINEVIFRYIQARVEEQVALEELESARKRYNLAAERETNCAKELNKMLGDK